MPREDLHLRAPAELKRRIEAYAAERGLTVNAAALILLRGALDREGRRG